MAHQFTWNHKKAASNKKKHSVTFEEAKSVFQDRLALIFDDDRHSNDEYREIIIGRSNRKRILVVSFTERRDAVRIISARKATQRERSDYEHQQY